MADAAASKAVEGNLMGVQVPSPALNLAQANFRFAFIFWICLKYCFVRDRAG